jgi:hypothetical protein
MLGFCATEQDRVVVLAWLMSENITDSEGKVIGEIKLTTR